MKSNNKQTSKQAIPEATIEFHKEELQAFYKEALASFMSQETPGYSETFYIHVLRYYMPEFMKKTYGKHKMGVGIFTMEGFEYKHYSSKHVIHERSNSRGNFCMRSLKYLTLQYINQKYDVQEEIKSNIKKENKKQSKG